MSQAARAVAGGAGATSAVRAAALRPSTSRQPARSADEPRNRHRRFTVQQDYGSPRLQVPEGEAWVSTENPLGEMGYYVVSKGDLGPFRVKIRSASFNNVSITPWVLRGVYVPDVVTILASLYFILGDIDR